jgi:hypothetical protein
MKLLRALHIDNKPYPLIEEQVVLDYSTPGRAQLLFDAGGAEIKNHQIVSLCIGYSRHESMQRLFLGYVEKVNVIDKRVKIFCRELSAVLNLTLPLDLRHVTMTEVLQVIGQKTGLQFAPGSGSYSSTKIANFYNLGNGYQALDLMARLFKIDDYFWQQQGGGVVYAGSWDDSRWASRAVEIEDSMFDEHMSHSARLAAVPALRPGVKLNGRIVSQVQFSGNHMDIQWKKP